MHTSPSRTRTVENAVELDREKELETRLALHDFYGRQLEIMNNKALRIKRFRNDLKASSVSLDALLNDPLMDEDCLDWLTRDADLYVMPMIKRPQWVNKFE
jgi:hypothetical protein